MTPKEKAEELVDKFMDVNYTIEDWKIDINIDYEAAKQCALITVDEIIKQENAIVPKLMIIIRTLMEKRNLKESFKGDVNQYWLDVKIEIKKL